MYNYYNIQTKNLTAIYNNNRYIIKNTLIYYNVSTLDFRLY